jgi:hypothetical protein
MLPTLPTVFRQSGVGRRIALMPHLLFPSWCPRCRQEILLHESILERISQRPKSSSKGDWRIDLVCAGCGYACAYDSKDFEPLQSDDPDPLLLPNGPTVFAVGVECDGRSCEFPVLVHAIRGPKATEQEIQAESSRWDFGMLTCHYKFHAKKPLRLVWPPKRVIF